MLYTILWTSISRDGGEELSERKGYERLRNSLILQSCCTGYIYEGKK